MPPEPGAELKFFPWLRRGLAAGIKEVDGSPIATAHASLQIKITIEDAITATPGNPEPTLAMLGPGEIIGLNPGTVVRTWPRPDDTDAEFGHFALIEFDQPDLPWRYTPAKATGVDTLRPWLCLVVLKSEGEASVAPPSSDQRLAVLTTTIDSLPRLAESWAWAHVQHAGSLGPDLAATLATDPKRVVARLICPRVLEPRTAYQAFLVPAFARGRQAGLGQAVTANALDLAWSGGPSDPVTLPVYYQWRFNTGSVGSFKDLVKLLVARPLPATVGIRDMDVESPGLLLPRAATSPLGLEGALKAASTASTPWPNADSGAATVKTTWISQLKVLVDTPDDLAGVDTTSGNVAPPLYGRWHAKATKIPAEGTPPVWFRELNIDPRTRVAAGLGTQVVQDQQQELMASAWRQVEQIRKVNQELRVLQVGVAAFTQVFARHLASVPDVEQLLLVSAPVQARAVTVAGGATTSPVTAFATFEDSPVADGVFDAQWRRLARSLGPIGRRQTRDPAVQSDILDRMNDGAFRAAGEPPVPSVMATPNSVGSSVSPPSIPPGNLAQCSSLSSEDFLFWGLVMFWVARALLSQGTSFSVRASLLRLGLFLIRCAEDPTLFLRSVALANGTFGAADIAAAPKAPTFTVLEPPPSGAINPLPPSQPGDVDSVEAAAFRTAAERLLTELRAAPLPGPVLQAVDLPVVNQTILSAIEPKNTINASMAARVTFTGDLAAWQPADPLEPILAAPEFPQPMSEPLRKLSQDWLLPGLDKVPPNTIGVAVTNQKFVEAYMVGLNHEMARELLWNEYPTDQRGTYFRQFWSTGGFVPAAGVTAPAPDGFKDIDPIHGWPGTTALGTNSSRPTSGHLVLLVRGQIVQAFPNLIVYANKAAGLTAPRALDTSSPSNELHPVFQGRLDPDVAFYGFELGLATARGDGVSEPGWFFLLQEQPAEPRFFVTGVAGTHVAPPAATAASVAAATLDHLTRIAVHGSDVLPGTP